MSVGLWGAQLGSRPSLTLSGRLLGILESARVITRGEGGVTSVHISLRKCRSLRNRIGKLPLRFHTVTSERRDAATDPRAEVAILGCCGDQFCRTGRVTGPRRLTNSRMISMLTCYQNCEPS